jgi:hypothetical protein
MHESRRQSAMSKSAFTRQFLPNSLHDAERIPGFILLSMQSMNFDWSQGV